MAALNKAISERRFKQVRFLIDLGTNLNLKDSEGKTALIQLCFLEPESLAVAIAVRLLKGGAKVDITDNEGLTAFSTAVKRQKESLVALFLDENGNFDLNSRDKKGNTALFYAADVGNLKILSAIVLALKKFQLSVNVPNTQGFTPLMQACINGDVITAKYLITEGNACLNSRDWNHKRTALEWAKTKGIQESVLLTNDNSTYNGLSKGNMCGALVEDNPQTRQSQCFGKKACEQDLGCRKGQRTYKDQLRQVYQVYEWQLTASFKLRKKTKQIDTASDLSEEQRNGDTRTRKNTDLPTSRNFFKGVTTAKLLKRNSVLANKNVPHPFPFPNFRRSLSFTDLTKFDNSERRIDSPTLPRIGSAQSRRLGKVQQEFPHEEARSSSPTIPTVLEVNEPNL
ncbi:uncharacterized protein LOC111336892 [Stylophora pistillata]|uniref:uncharacterized protein LOC111336892 n=1 Tax=Stylophora pistillata TaxID=50429 RepID=UPI000C050F7F|nr:uncharacterized protein LOC111336892 [Stylophora pistillata]